MAELARVEYEALRATIRERGTLRVWLFLAGMSVWGALALGLSFVDGIEGAVTILPLMALAATFEAIYAVHVAVERIGRFVQVHYETEPRSTARGPTPATERPLTLGAPLPCWETLATMYARRFPGPGPDALFITWFSLAALLNFFLVPDGTFNAHPGWLVVRVVAHLVFGWHLWTARKVAAGLRTIDLERFSALKRDGPETP